MLKDYLGNNNRVLFFQFEMFGFLLLFLKKMLFLAIPRPSLGDSRGDRLTKRMLITAIFYNFDPKIIGKCFFIFPKFWFSRFLGEKKGKKWPKMTKDYACYAPYLKNHTPYDVHSWYTCVKWYLQVLLSFFPDFDFPGSLVG